MVGVAWQCPLGIIVVVGRWRYLFDENECFITWKYENNSHFVIRQQQKPGSSCDILPRSQMSTIIFHNFHVIYHSVLTMPTPPPSHHHNMK